jgi:hypothetical protein
LALDFLGFILREIRRISPNFVWILLSISLDFLGFSRPNQAFSMGCGRSSAKKNIPALFPAETGLVVPSKTGLVVPSIVGHP